MAQPRVGELVREWRTRRRRSQLDLALDVGMSTRHLSFVETGRSRPSPELVLMIADRLDVPLRERNSLLLAAGYAPRFSERSYTDDAMSTVRGSLQRMLDAHDPYPGVVIDRYWNVVAANVAATALLDSVDTDALGAVHPQPATHRTGGSHPGVNVYRVCLHPHGLAARTVNFPEWADYLLGQLRRSIGITGDAQLGELLTEVSGYPGVIDAGVNDRVDVGGDPPLLVPIVLRAGPTPDAPVLSLFTTLTTFGTPRDVTLDELAVELFFPADDETALLLRG